MCAALSNNSSVRSNYSPSKYDSKSNLTVADLPGHIKAARVAIKFFTLIAALALGTIFGGLLGSVIPVYGTLLGASIGGAGAFTIALEFLEISDKKLVENFAVSKRVGTLGIR